ncbi:pyruvate dehydrogenase E1 component subunit alpha, putative [Plasmodium malariae]|uniref:Pyruvate dehydrogenase E1 component subunit alpha, putative n=1 Tax=Plasmodium malariae TaxID=5858 RepID=A0A1D3PBU8_PLAMA|nr:pyruvate dehydrogenase E1 component subunit alpha, putative [Plasmodium malariae]SCN12764.1 pyruvate dehydrogenase E1 component subunit alpha, putative [Plasmodium malariae]
MMADKGTVVYGSLKSRAVGAKNAEGNVKVMNYDNEMLLTNKLEDKKRDDHIGEKTIRKRITHNVEAVVEGTTSANKTDVEKKNYSDFNIYIENNKIKEYISDIDITKEEICTLYEDMHMGRMFENLVAKLYYSKKINGFVHLYNGQEAISSGIIKNLTISDFVTSTYRDHVHAISKGVPPKEVLNELYGNYYGSTNKGKGGSMHIYSKTQNFIGGFGFIGEQIPIAVGLAYSILYKREFSSDAYGFTAEQWKQRGQRDEAWVESIDERANQNGIGSEEGHHNSSNNGSSGDSDSGSSGERSKIDVVVCFLGDGTTNIGQFFESLNLAATYNLPIIFVIENNNWAIGMENSRASVNDIMNNYTKGKAFNIETYKIDGNDVLSIYKLAKKKINDIRNRKCGPVLIEAITYRSKGHSLADPDELRLSEEKTSWRKRDPLVYLSNYMKKENIVDESYFEKIKKKIQNILEDAQNDANENYKKSQHIDICHLFKHNIFAPSENTPYNSHYENYKKFDNLSHSDLREYYQALLKENERKRKNKKNDITEKFDEKKIPLLID